MCVSTFLALNKCERPLEGATPDDPLDRAIFSVLPTDVFIRVTPKLVPEHEGEQSSSYGRVEREQHGFRRRGAHGTRGRFRSGVRLRRTGERCSHEAGGSIWRLPGFLSS